MPEISRCPGIIIYMLYDDHRPPHFRAQYGENRISVEINSGVVAFGGSCLNSAARLSPESVLPSSAAGWAAAKGPRIENSYREPVLRRKNVTVRRGTVPIFAAQWPFLPNHPPFPPRKWDYPLRLHVNRYEKTMFDGFQQAVEVFRKAGVGDPLLETLRLFDVLSSGRIREADGNALPQAELETLAAQRKDGVPLEYVLGKAVFMGLQLDCSPGALIPREETELLARTALDLIRARQAGQPRLTAVDMGTGSGNIAVALAVHTQDVDILACDVSPEALEVARRQVAKFNVHDRVSLFCGDLYEPLLAAGYQGQVDLVVCNPPYLPTSTLARLAREIVDHEPAVALDAGPYGINVFRRLIAGAAEVLKPDGVLVFEFGAGQEKLIARLLEGCGAYPHVEYYRDAAGPVRVVSVGRPLAGRTTNRMLGEP